MKKLIASAHILLFIIVSISGCSMTGQKSTSLSTIYGIAAFFSLLLLIGCIFLVHQSKKFFIMLFASVLVVNIGYTLLSISSSLEMALWANRISYLGSVFLPHAMLLIILKVTATKYPNWLHGALSMLSIIVFLITASCGILPIYYKQVSFAIVNGVSTLIKVYGPLHILYLFYLLGYFSAMVAVIIRAQIKKTINSITHAIILAIAVFVNIGVWFIEQLVSMNFEILSISYIISELFLLGIHLVVNEYYRLSQIVKHVESSSDYLEEECSAPDIMLEKPIENEAVDPARIEFYLSGLKTLTPSEKIIYDAYIARVTTKEVMANMNIKESTLKYHNRNIYSKLGVSTRKELLELHKHIKSMKSKLEEVSNVT